VLVELVAEQLGIHGRRLRQERRAEARRERRLRLRDAHLRPASFAVKPERK
jgi:hypothetical protein